MRLLAVRKSTRVIPVALTTTSLVVLLAALPAPQQLTGYLTGARQTQSDHPAQFESALLNQLQLQPAVAQRFDERDAWRKVYQQIPDLPLENQYINRDTGKASEENTLVGRFIRYHIYVKQRSPYYRLDWKLTLADYLEANERIVPETYPSADAFRQNPLQGDTAVIKGLNRAQRDVLVQALVNVFAPAAAISNPTGTPDPMPSPSSQPAAPSSPPLQVAPPIPREPQPGDAQLLQP